MKATGEVMGIGATLTESFLKSIRSLETGVCHLHLGKFDSMSQARTALKPGLYIVRSGNKTTKISIK